MKGNFQFDLYIFLQKHLNKLEQRGAAEARRAHNPEDPGSKPGVANFFVNSSND